MRLTDYCLRLLCPTTLLLACGAGDETRATAATGDNGGKTSSSAGSGNAGSAGAGSAGAALASGAGNGGAAAGTGGSAGSSGSPAAGGKLGICDAVSVGGSRPTGTPPELTPGVWQNITPAALDMLSTYGTTGVSVDPTNTAILYLDTDQRGLWKSLNRGATWTRLGSPPNGATDQHATDYLDSPICRSVHHYRCHHVDLAA